jgi:hypothetical protein
MTATEIAVAIGTSNDIVVVPLTVQRRLKDRGIIKRTRVENTATLRARIASRHISVAVHAKLAWMSWLPGTMFGTMFSRHHRSGYSTIWLCGKRLWLFTYHNKH